MSTTMTKPSSIFQSPNIVLAFMFGVMSAGMSIWVFVLSRTDHDMKLMALGAVISNSSSLMATASTMLVGKDFGERTISAPPLPEGAAKVKYTEATSVESASTTKDETTNPKQ